MKDAGGEHIGGGHARRGVVAGGAVLGALAASSCCILPLVLVSLGLGGAWMGGLTALAPYQPYFMALTVVLLAAGFRLAYRKPAAACGPEGECTRPGSGRMVKIALWSAALLVLAILALPYLAPLYGGV